MTEALSVLAERGLNIFASVRVRKLPEEILRDFSAARLEHSGKETIGIVAHGGRSLWDNLKKPLNQDEHPIDTYARQQVEWLNDTAIKDPNLRVLFPGGPLIPLQKLGRALNISRPSLLGLDMNESYGVWFAFRAVFLTDVEIPEIQPKDFASACETCTTKPCQKVCPAAAVQGSAKSFQLGSCATYRLSRGSECLDKCLARIACPFKAEHSYSIEQSRYHNLRIAHLNRLAQI